MHKLKPIDPRALEEIWNNRLLEHESMFTGLKSLQNLAYEMYAICHSTLQEGGTIFTAGNGGSAADAQHFAGELVGKYGKVRPGLASVCLNTDPSVMTCIANDFGYDQVFARQLEALGSPADCFIAFSTSGRSPNILNAIQVAHKIGMKSVLMSSTKSIHTIESTLVFDIPSNSTAAIQEGHTFLLHALSEMFESHI